MNQTHTNRMVHNNVQDFKKAYKEIVLKLIKCRKSSGISGEAKELEHKLGINQESGK